MGDFVLSINHATDPLAYQEISRVHPEDVQSDHSREFQMDFKRWCVNKDIFHTSMDYVAMVRLYYLDRFDITWAPKSYVRGIVTYQNQYGDDIDELYATEYDGMELIN